MKVTSASLALAWAAGFGAAGAVDFNQVIGADQNDYFAALAASNTSYLSLTYVDGIALPTPLKTLAPPQYDNFYDRTKQSLLHFEGADAAVATTDDYGNTWTFAGNAQLDTAQKKFGNSSLLLDGTGDYLESADFTSLGSGSWQLESWFRVNALPGAAENDLILVAENAAGHGAKVWIDQAGGQRLGLALSANGTSSDISSSVSVATIIAVNIWYRLRLVFDALAGTYRLYLSNNGAAETQELTVSSTARICSITKIRLGKTALAGFTDFNGWIDEFRFSPCARSTSLEAVPSAAVYSVATAGESSDFFSIPEMKMYQVSAASAAAGVNPTFTAVNKLYIGEVDTGAGAPSAIRSFAFRGNYMSPLLAASSATVYVQAHNLGTKPRVAKAVLICQTTDQGFYPGDEFDLGTQMQVGAGGNCGVDLVQRKNELVLIFANNIGLSPASGGGTPVTISATLPTHWRVRTYVSRGW